MKNFDNKTINIEEELKNSYLDYAMSVIIGRALPDVRDGLKPVHRRILYAMNILKNDFNKSYKKSARIVGDVIGKYHPHGDNSVYDAIVRMAQKFSLRYTLIDGQGNFGSIDGDSAAAMRYTEIRMSKIAHELLYDLEKNTVDFDLNYDNSEYIPTILPSRIPNLLINGSYGIAVGVATNIPPHNLSEIIDGCLALIKNENINTLDLMKYIPGPDFPTAAIIHGKKDIENIYNTGKGKICIKSKTKIEINEINENKSIIIEEIPYQVNKVKLIEKIAELIKNKKINGINDLRDESNQKGIRIVIDLKKDISEEVILNNLYTNTSLQTFLYVNMVALCDSKPKLMSLKEMLIYFIKHRENIIYRRTLFSLKKCNEKIHILEGFIIAINNIEEIINIIKNSKSINIVKDNLLKIKFKINNSFLENKIKYEKLTFEFNKENLLNNNYYNFSINQIKSILDLKLQRLTNLEYENILKEYNSIIEKIKYYMWIIKDKKNLKKVIYKELSEIKLTYKDKRLTKIIEDELLINSDLLIKNFEVLITLSYYGYIKYQPLSDYEAQKRGGKGKSSTKIKSEDFINCLLVSYTHDDILLFSNKGRMFRMKVYQLPESSRGSKGKPISNLISLDKNERITSILSVKLNELNNNNYYYVLMVTSNGFIKKTNIKELIKSRNSGFIVIKLNKKDELVGVNITNGKNSIMLFSENGKVVKFLENKIRVTSRTSLGVKGMNLINSDKIVSLIISNNNNKQILTITKNGFGKRTYENEYPIKSRATQGVISIKINEKNGKVIKSIKVNENDQILIITNFGTLVRIRVSEIRISGRNTYGVKLIKVSKNENIVDLKRIINNNLN